MQPGVIDTRMAKEIIVRSQSFNNRLPLLAQLQQRGVTKSTQPEQVSIVYAVPLPRESSAANHTPALPTTQNSQTTQPLIVQAKCTSPSNSAISITAPTVQPSPRSFQESKPLLLQAKFADSSNSGVSPKLPIKSSSPLAPNGENSLSKIERTLDGHQASLNGAKNLPENLGENLSVSPSPISAIDQVPIIYTQPLLPKAEITQSTSEPPDKQNFQISQLPVVQAKLARPNNFSTEQSLFSESLLTGMQSLDISGLKSQEKQKVRELISSRDSATTLPKNSVENLLSSQLSVQQIPIVYAHLYVQNSQQSSSEESQGPVVQVTSQLNSLLSHQPESLIFSPNSTARQKATAINSTEQINEYRETSKQETQTATKLYAEAKINQIPTNTISQTPDSIDLIPITFNQAKNHFESEKHPEPKINLDALADKLERKLMRRLVVESERRGRIQWR